MAGISNDTNIFIQETSTTKKDRRYFLLLVSPLAWFKCCALIFCRTRARTRSNALLQYSIFLLVLLLMISSCYLFYAVAADAGQYNLYLSNVASNKSSIIDCRRQFDDLIWRTVIKTFFLGLIFGLIQACNVFLAAQWRQRLCDRFRELLFRSPNGCVLYATSQIDEDIPKSKIKGCLHGYMQRIQTNADCIILYASQRVELEYIERFILNMRNSMLIGSISFALINFPIQLLSALNGMCTYIMPAVVFFFIRQTQSPELAQTYLTVIPLYSFLITVLNAVNAPLLQSDVNLEAARGQCILISGPSGCGKTSLFRICAGLWPANAKQLILPERSHLIFIPQRPYLPRGSLRFQVLLLLKEHNHIIDQDIYQLFQVVNLLYLLQRYTLDTIIDWPTVLSVGEQQRLSFIRLLAFFTLTPNNDQLIRKTLVLFDEATSAIDVTTEHEIYARLIQLRVWFVTISHRSSLVHLHAKSLHFFSNKDRQQSIEQTQTECQVLTLNDGDDEKKLEENENNEIEAIDIKYCQIDSESRKNDDMSNVNEKDISKWRLILNILKFIHLPFQANDKMLKLQTIVAWLLTLGVLGASTWSTYKFTKQTASLYSVLSDYGSGSISLAQAKESIKSNIVNYVILMVATPTLFSLTVGGGQLLATLYTRRQMVFLARLLLDRSFEEYENNLLYHSRHMTAIPNILSHDIAEMNIISDLTHASSSSSSSFL
ncbi:unnamed protein product [Rotaria sordida]|uniref:ABC transporter domain-containing protein n=1 Tax=Rotaria sordida TaxID=392033 RepID=A0A815IJ38_9BILA|nr:unnamed protein product [Rotaria sordida]